MSDEKSIDEIEEIPLSEDQLAAIGRITVLGTILEHEVELLIFRLMDVSGLIGLAITRGVPFTQLCDKAEDLGNALIATPADYSWFLEVLARAREAYSLRNDIVHAEWSPGFDERPLRIRITRGRGIEKDKIESRSIHLSDADFAFVQRQLEQAIGKLREFTFRRAIAGREALRDDGATQRALASKPE